MEAGILKMALSWALARLNERNTWVTWLSVAAVKFGITLDPTFDSMLINIALAVVATLGYAIQGKPLFTKDKK